LKYESVIPLLIYSNSFVENTAEIFAFKNPFFALEKSSGKKYNYSIKWAYTVTVCEEKQNGME